MSAHPVPSIPAASAHAVPACVMGACPRQGSPAPAVLFVVAHGAGQFVHGIDAAAPVAFAVAGLPTTNRGVSQLRTLVSVDWVAASVDLAAVLREQGEPRTWDVLADVNGFGWQSAQVSAAIFCAFFAGTRLVLDAEQRRGTFYKWRYHLTSPDGKKVGQIEFGGPHTMRTDGTQTARIELTGDGCRLYEGEAEGDHAERWSRLRAKLASLGGKLSRVDCCYDDLDGIYNVAHALKLWASGRFDARGQRPECDEYNNLKRRKGDTLYIGSKASEKFMRVYEKGKQQGDDSSHWVRWEVQFRASTRRDLDLDMLVNPGEFMRGAYAALSFISAVAQRLDVTKESAAATLKSAMRHLRRQYGAALNFLRHATPDDAALGEFISQNVVRSKLPKWADQYFSRGVFADLLDAMRSPRDREVLPATDEEIQELCHAR